MPVPEVIAIFGPTGIGKTAVAVALAERLAAEGEHPIAVSADALQVYAGLGLLTGAPDAAQRERLEHRLVGTLPVSHTFSAGEYAAMAHREIDGALAEGRRPIVVGGTGLYLRAALADLDMRPAVDPAIRRGLIERQEREGADALHRELASVDPALADGIAPADRHRIVRSLELIAAGHEPPRPGESSALWTSSTRHPTLLVGLHADREVLFRRIDERVLQMVAEGAADEVRAADAAGASPTARAAVGFRELLVDDIPTMQARTRRYAKRQLTWMRKLSDVVRLDVTTRTPEEAAATIMEHLTVEV